MTPLFPYYCKFKQFEQQKYLNLQLCRLQQINYMNHSQQHSRTVEIISDFLYFDLFPFKKFHDLSVRVPETVLLQKGQIKEWLFNSTKENGKILRKKKENCTPLNLLKHFCLKFCGISFTRCQSIAEIRSYFSNPKPIQNQQVNSQDLKLIRKLQDVKRQGKKLVQILTVDNDVYSMGLFEFVDNLAQNKFSDHMFYEKWKLIRQKINSEARIDECYDVFSLRKNHVIESKCHKVIAFSTGQLSEMLSSTELQKDPFSAMNPSIAFKAEQTKNMEGYKFFDSFLNKKFFKIAQELIEFVEKNYKCIVQEAKTKFMINKGRQPFLVGIYGLKVKPTKKLAHSPEFIQFAAKGYIKLEEYLKRLNNYITEYEKLLQPNLNALNKNTVKFKCHGEFCQAKVKQLPPIKQFNEKAKLFQLDFNSHPHNKRRINSELITAVKRRKSRVLQKMKSLNIIDYNHENFLNEDSSEYQDSEGEGQKAVRVCQNCWGFYLHVEKLYELDLRSGNLLERRQVGSGRIMTVRSQSDSKLPPLKKVELLEKKQDREQNTKKLKRRSATLTYPKEFSVQKKDKPSTPEKTKQKQGNVFQRLSSQSIKNREPKRSLAKKVILDPLQQKALKTQPSSGKRLLALSKVNYGLKGKSEKVQPKSSTLIYTNNNTKARNFQQAEVSLVQRLSLLPSSSREEFIHYAKKYYENNLPQQLDRKCFSSQYPVGLYEFMSNSPINLPQTNRIKKRPEISLKRLSELTDYPQIVSKSAFHFDTLITDEKTTIPFCVITSRMVNGRHDSHSLYETIIFVGDMFDCFIEYISLTKNVLENTSNKRVVLFNFPGQSHTIYASTAPILPYQFGQILDKLLYRLCTEKGELGLVNFEKDKVKLMGVGYGAHLVATYLAANYNLYKSILSGVFLINPYKFITFILKEKLEALLQLYESEDEMAQTQAYLFFSKAVGSSEIDTEDLDYKASLNPILLSGRSFIIRSLLRLAVYQHNSHNSLIEQFQHVSFCPVHILYGKDNILVSRSHVERFLVYEDTRTTKQQIPQRKLIEVKGGYDLMTDNYDDLEKYIEFFLNL